MGSYLVIHRSAQYGVVTGEYVPEKVAWSIRDSEPGTVTYEIPLSEPFLTSPEGGNPEFGPYQTHWYLYRAGVGQNYTLLNAGEITSVNLNGDRDTVLVAGKDWLHYLERRQFPFNPTAYIEGDWVNWPVGWPHEVGSYLEVAGNPVDVVTIVQEILTKMKQVGVPAIPGVGAETNPAWHLPIVWNNGLSGLTTKYSILPADTASIYDHINTLAEQVDGFEFDILPQSMEFKMYFTGRDGGQNVYNFRLSNDPDQDAETFGAVTAADWTNDGPAGTFLWGTGVGEHRTGAVWYYKPALDKFLWMDKRYDYGEMRNTDLIFNMLKDENDIHPQEKLGITLLNPEFMSLNFFTGDRPRSLIGNRVGFRHVWAPYREVDNPYKVNAINCRTDQSSNEYVELELEIILE